MTLNRRNIIFSLLLLVVMGIQLVVTTGTSLAESSIKIDSDLALTPDQELSNEKQIVIKVSDKAKAQRDLSLTVPAGATFDSTATEKLNQDPTYSVEFDPKDKTRQVILKGIVKAQVRNESEASNNVSAPIDSLKSVTKKDYLLVFKIDNSTTLSKQQLKVTTELEGKRYESKSLNFKESINLESNPNENDFVHESLVDNSIARESIGDTTTSGISLVRSVPSRPPELDSDLEYYYSVEPGTVITNSDTDGDIRMGTVDLYANNLEGGVPGPNTTKLAMVPRLEPAGFKDVRLYGLYSSKIKQRQAVMTNGDISTTSVKATKTFANVVSVSQNGQMNGFWYNDTTAVYLFKFSAGDFDIANQSPKAKDINMGFRVTGTRDRYLFYRMLWQQGEYPPPHVSSVVVHYVDENGNKLTSDVVLKGTVGTNYTTEEKSFDGYQLKSIQGNPSGKFTSAQQTVTYIYSKKENKPQISVKKAVKNLSTSDDNYSEETKGRLNDEISYQIDISNASQSSSITGVVVEDILDSALTSDKQVKIEYFATNNILIKQATGSFDENGHVALDYIIPIAGHATITFTAQINSNSKDVINNIAAVSTNKEKADSNDTKINLVKQVAPIIQKDVRNVTNDEAEFGKETVGSVSDEVEYRVLAVNPSTEESIPKETMFGDQLDEDLVNDTPVTVEYYSVLGTKTATQEAYFQNGKFKLDYEIEPNGYIMVYFKAKIGKTTKTVINNTATLADGKSDVAKVNIVEKTPPTVIKEVKNLTKADDDFVLETEAEVDDQVEYRIQLVNLSSVDTKVGTVLKDVLDSDLDDIQQVKIDYLDKDENITATQTADLTDDQVTLDHVLPAAGRGMAIAYIKAKVKETDKSVINNKASLTTEFGKGTSDNAKLNIKQSKGRIVVRYRDRKDESHKLAEDETFDGKIGDTKLVQPKVIPETDGNWTVVDSSNMTNPDWGSTTKPDWTLAHDYTVTYAKDEQVITYRYEESHIGIIADKRWDFGKHDTTATDRNYYLKAKTQNDKKQPYEVGVEDYYTSKGWTLNVKQDDQFHTNANEKIGGSQKFLDNAVLNFHNGQIVLKESDDIGSTAPVSKLTSEFELVPQGAAVNLMTHTNKTPDPGYYAAHGFGIWAYQFGDAQQADYSIGLKVPKATKRFPRQYTSQLTWSLVIAE
ncbi:MucBP domain-containing protein [Latilactobacillus sakei]|uniref:MucBP domain-containing protein n=1 Tax=Latilactobacillus sakei TaxID=1599 RepID=UPI003F531C7A